MFLLFVYSALLETAQKHVHNSICHKIKGIFSKERAGIQYAIDVYEYFFKQRELWKIHTDINILF